MVDVRHTAMIEQTRSHSKGQAGGYESGLAGCDDNHELLCGWWSTNQWLGWEDGNEEVSCSWPTD